jgi:cysteinyl-tRNA synthetase
MALKFRNVLTRRVQTFHSLEPGVVKMYADGPTVDAHVHLSLARRIVVNDLIKRVLLVRGYRVVHVMNITDLDDRTIAASAEAGEDLRTHTRRFEQAFFDDMETLGVLPADYTPRTSDHIEQMLELTRKLMQAGYCYEMLRNVYFDVSKTRGYGRFSGVNPDKIRVGSTVDLDDYEKDDPRDFVMFKRCDLAELRRGIGVKSEWGNVRPGWHVQCAAMSTHYLGLKFDLHVSTRDLAFPHHENEIAIVSALTGQPPAHTWLHSELVYAGGKKMSAFSGNMKTVRDLREAGFDGRLLRFWMISCHYRQPLQYSEEGLEQARAALARIDGFARRLRHARGAKRHPELAALAMKAESDFFAALDDDLNISAAMAVFGDFVRKTNALQAEQPLSRADARDALATLYRIDAVLGVFDFADDQLDREIEELLARRETARAAGDYTAADAIRDELRQRGFQISDTPHGPSIEPVE